MDQINSRGLQTPTIPINEKYLLLVPKIKAGRLWKTDNDGLVEIVIPRDKLLDNIVRLFCRTPEAIRIHLDPQGSFVWTAIDGCRSVLDISMLLEAEFGENARPLYSRLLRYLHILENNRFITMRKI